jgi:MarR family transcriptional regulator, organic hydroperoxide resistance regulator
MATRARADPATEAWQLILRVFGSERPPRFPAVASEFDLSPVGLHVLKMLAPGAELPMSALADSVGCDASNITGIVDRLEARGLIERRDSPHDRRVKLIAVTDEGERLRALMVERLHRPPEVIARLSRADQRALRDVLRRALAEEAGRS